MRMKMTHYVLDLETAPNIQTDATYALEPYRVAQDLARVTSVAVYGPDGYKKQLDERNVSGSMEEFPALLASLAGKEVWAHRAVFDAAWSIATTNFDLVRAIKWRDSALLVKWLINGQVAEAQFFKYSLHNCVKRFVGEHPDKAEFLDLKQADVKPGENYEYWLKRGIMDVEFTWLLVNNMWPKLAEEQRRGFLIEQGNIATVARGWLFGLHLDREQAMALWPKVKKLKGVLADKLKKPQAMFTSPKQLQSYLYKELGLPILFRNKPTKTNKEGSPKTNKDTLLVLRDRYKDTEYDQILKTILDFKQIATMESKFLKGIEQCTTYNQRPYGHASPSIFGTYTGRYTYAAKNFNKWPIGIASHQIPRTGPIRHMLTAPDGYDVAELDGAQQELRFIGQISGDHNLLHDFNHGLDPHSGMGAHVNGMPYEEFVRLYHEEDPEVTNVRYAGKLLNLSCQYRIGGKSLAFKFFTTYNLKISTQQAYRYLDLYKSRYSGVVDYWRNAILVAKTRGYAETIARRRYHIKFWSESYSFKSEQSGINFPIQGSGGDHKNAAISILAVKFPEAIFPLDLHDGLWYYLPKEHSRELLLDMQSALNKVNWSALWNADVHLPLPFDAKIGTSFGNVKELKHDAGQTEAA